VKAPTRLRLVLACFHQALGGPLADQVESGKETVIRAAVMAVEGAAGNSGSLRETSDSECLIAIGSDELDHRQLQPRSLVSLDYLPTETGAGSEPPIASR